MEEAEPIRKVVEHLRESTPARTQGLYRDITLDANPAGLETAIKLLELQRWDEAINVLHDLRNHARDHTISLLTALAKIHADPDQHRRAIQRDVQAAERNRGNLSPPERRLLAAIKRAGSS